jgi:NitT/TauT family transport system substrate-binding protein
MHCKTIGALAVLALALIAGVTPAHAEISELKVARQFGISFLPLMVMQEKKLFEKHA